MCMISVGIRDLKNKLSHYLRLVREGETVLVRDRSRIVAEIRKFAPDSGKSKLDAYLESGELQGTIIPAKRSKSNISAILSEYATPDTKIDWRREYRRTRVDRQ